MRKAQIKEWSAEMLATLAEDGGSVRAAAACLGIPESSIRTKLKRSGVTVQIPAEPLPDHGYQPGPEELPSTHVGEEGVETVDLSDSTRVRRFILTSAQNNCRVHEGFLANLKALAADIDAELLVSYVLYDKAGYTGLVRQGGKRQKRDVWWDKAVQPYAFNKRGMLHRRLAFCGEFDLLATAAQPLSGLESYCGRSSIIVPHNRFAFKCIESRKHQMPKEMFTTGSVTVRNFIQRKAGQVAAFHHVLGALLVEVTAEGYWHVHHLNAEDDGSFYWLDKRVHGGEVRQTVGSIAGLVVGDVHSEKMNAKQNRVLHDFILAHQPQHILIHDLIDFTSRNHHNIKDPIFRVEVQHTPVEKELRQAAAWLSRLCDTCHGKVVVVKSNHDEALTRWIKDTDWRTDPQNAEFYLLVARLMVIAATAGHDFDPLKWAMEVYRLPLLRDYFAKFLAQDESYEVCGIECGIHGHVGPSGTRGTPRGYSRLGFKTFTAHTHSPSIVDGCYTVGVLGNLDMGYNVGPSKWMHAHGLIYPNGKRAFLFVKNGKWKA